MTSKCTSIAAHFEGLADLPVRYKVHCLMQHVQGYTGSHWMLLFECLRWWVIRASKEGNA